MAKIGRIRPSQTIELLRHDDVCNQLEGYLYRREGARLAYLASLVPADQAIVELGAFRGKSTVLLALGSKAGHRAHVHSFDLWTLGGQGEYVHLGFDTEDTLAAFRRQVSEHKVKSMVTEHQGDSAMGGVAWQGPPVGLLFIDGDHRADPLRADLEAWLPNMAPGGWVAFHDYGTTSFPGVVQVVDPWVRDALESGLVVEVTRIARVVAVKLGTWAEPVEGTQPLEPAEPEPAEPEPAEPAEPDDSDADVMSKLRKIAEEES